MATPWVPQDLNRPARPSKRDNQPIEPTPLPRTHKKGMAQPAWKQACEAQFPGWELADLLQTDIRKMEGERVTFPRMEGVEGIVPGPFILQVISIVDATKPSTKQLSDGGAGRLLLVRVSDGANKATAFELHRVPKLTLDTPPGVKLLVSNVRYCKNKLLLEPGSVLGVEGTVEVLANNFRSSRLLEQAYKLGKDLQVKKSDGENPPSFDMFKPSTGGKGERLTLPKTPGKGAPAPPPPPPGLAASSDGPPQPPPPQASHAGSYGGERDPGGRGRGRGRGRGNNDYRGGGGGRGDGGYGGRGGANR